MRPKQTADLEKIFQEAKAGNDHALAELLSLHWSRATTYAKLLVGTRRNGWVDEIVCEAAESIRGSFRVVSSVEDFAKYLLAAVYSRALNKIRAEKRRGHWEDLFASTEEYHRALDERDEVEEEHDRVKFLVAYKAAREKLELPLRQAFEGMVLGEHSMVKLSSMLRVSTRTISRRYESAVAILRRELRDFDPRTSRPARQRRRNRQG